MSKLDRLSEILEPYGKAGYCFIIGMIFYESINDNIPSLSYLIYIMFLGMILYSKEIFGRFPKLAITQHDIKTFRRQQIRNEIYFQGKFSLFTKTLHLSYINLIRAVDTCNKKIREFGFTHTELDIKLKEKENGC